MTNANFETLWMHAIIKTTFRDEKNNQTQMAFTAS